MSIIQVKHYQDRFSASDGESWGYGIDENKDEYIFYGSDKSSHYTLKQSAGKNLLAVAAKKEKSGYEYQGIKWFDTDEKVFCDEPKVAPSVARNTQTSKFSWMVSNPPKLEDFGLVRELFETLSKESSDWIAYDSENCIIKIFDKKIGLSAQPGFDKEVDINFATDLSAVAFDSPDFAAFAVWFTQSLQNKANFTFIADGSELQGTLYEQGEALMEMGARRELLEDLGLVKIAVKISSVVNRGSSPRRKAMI